MTFTAVPPHVPATVTIPNIVSFVIGLAAFWLGNKAKNKLKKKQDGPKT